LILFLSFASGRSTGSINTDPTLLSSLQGTHVAGTILALGGNSQGVLGVNRNGKIGVHIVRLFDDDGYAWASDFVELVNDCVSNNANVVSMRCERKVGHLFKILVVSKTVFLSFSLSAVLVARREVRWNSSVQRSKISTRKMAYSWLPLPETTVPLKIVGLLVTRQ
jgi:hypothetical protein